MSIQEKRPGFFGRLIDDLETRMNLFEEICVSAGNVVGEDGKRNVMIVDTELPEAWDSQKPPTYWDRWPTKEIERLGLEKEQKIIRRGLLTSRIEAVEK